MSRAQGYRLASAIVTLALMSGCRERPLDTQPAPPGASVAVDLPAASSASGPVVPPIASAAPEGERDVAAVPDSDAVIRAVKPRVRGCWGAGLTRNSDMEGRVTFALSLDATGKVTGVKLTLSGSLDPTVGTCIRTILAGLVFAPPTEKNASVTGNFSFVNAGKGK